MELNSDLSKHLSIRKAYPSLSLVKTQVMMQGTLRDRCRLGNTVLRLYGTVQDNTFSFWNFSSVSILVSDISPNPYRFYLVLANLCTWNMRIGTLAEFLPLFLIYFLWVLSSTIGLDRRVHHI